jgi:hypothetical protein
MKVSGQLLASASLSSSKYVLWNYTKIMDAFLETLNSYKNITKLAKTL